jgi:transposase
MEAKRQEMSTPLKQVIIELFSNGEKVSDIASSVASVYRVIRKFESTGSTENLPRPGRPRSISDREYRRLQRIVNKDRRAPLRDITAEFNDRTIKRRLKENVFLKGCV